MARDIRKRGITPVSYTPGMQGFGAHHQALQLR
jgi:hypothetical protein